MTGFSAWSALYLLLVFTGHVAATRVPGLFAGMPADFSFLTFSLAHWPLVFYPYYVLFVLAGVYHLTNGLLIALRVAGLKLPGWATAPASKPFWVFVAGVGALGVLGVLALAGGFYSVDTHRFIEFKAFYEKIVPAFLLPWNS